MRRALARRKAVPVPSRTGEIPSPTLSARLRDLHDRREAALPRRRPTRRGAPPSGHHPARRRTARHGSARRVLFPRIQELTLDGRDSAEITTVVVSGEAARVIDLLEPSLADYAVATA